nr:N-formylglutamate amidohydrolase [Methylocapsa palsarum]
MAEAKPGAKDLDSSAREPELEPPFDSLGPDPALCPLVLSSPHSGSVYPRRFLETCRLDLMALRRSEDAFVDELFSGVCELGAPLLRARFPRSYLDLNREPYELDPRLFDGRLPTFANTRSLRVAGGLGTIPRVVGQAQEIYAGRLPVEEGLRRIDLLYKPYHSRLRDLLARTKEIFGLAVLVDCHSMPSGAVSPSPLNFLPIYSLRPSDPPSKADFVIGDRHGTSCAPELISVVENELRRLGYAVKRNKPYAGGFITEYYGDPAANCHAIQIEVCRALYMDEQNVVKSARFDEIRAALAKVGAMLAAAITTRRETPRAAAE